MAAPNSTTTTVFVGGGAPVKVGDDTADLVGFYGTAGSAQAATISAVTTTGVVLISGTAIYGFETAAQAALLIADVNAIRTALRNLGIMA